MIHYHSPQQWGMRNKAKYRAITRVILLRGRVLMSWGTGQRQIFHKGTEGRHPSSSWMSLTTRSESVFAAELVHSAKSWWPRAESSLSSDCTCLAFVPEPERMKHPPIQLGKRGNCLTLSQAQRFKRHLFFPATSVACWRSQLVALEALWTSHLCWAQLALRQGVQPPPALPAWAQGWAALAGCLDTAGNLFIFNSPWELSK